MDVDTFLGKHIRFPQFETDVTQLTQAVIHAMNDSDITATSEEKVRYLLTVFFCVLQITVKEITSARKAS